MSTARRLFTWRNAMTGGVLAFALWGVVAAGWIIFGSGAAVAGDGSGPPPPPLAVLPFDDLSPDEENAFFAAGIHEEILTQLSRIGGIRLVSRTSVMRYETTDKSLGEIAAELGVSAILEGSVRRAGDRVRIKAQLVDARTDESLWAASYDRELSDIFTIQTDVATRVVEELRGVLTPEERAELARAPTDNLEAYAHYLRGHEHFWRLWIHEDTRAAAAAYQRAVELDPEFAAAWARLVQARIWLAWQHDELEERVRARRALDHLKGVAPDSPELRFARGLWFYYGEQRFDEALREFEALAEVWPGDADVMKFRSALYRRVGRWEEATRVMKQLLELDPADAAFAANLGETYTMMRRFQEAERYAHLAVSLDPTVPFHWSFLVLTRMARGDTAAARVAVDSAARHLGEEAVESGWAWALLRFCSGGAEDILDLYRAPTLPGSGLPDLGLPAAVVADDSDLVLAYEERALQALSSLPEGYPLRRSAALAYLAVARAHLGSEAEAVDLANQAVELYPVSRDAFIGVRRVISQAHVYAIVGRHDDAVARLRYLLSIPAEMVTVPLLRLDPRWDPLRDHPGFQALLEEEEEAAQVRDRV